MSADLDWSADAPRSRRYQDIYFSAADGLAESQAVFLDGCGFPASWAGRTSFCVAELGFGTGLNVAALLHLWRRTKPPGARLSIFTVEAELMDRADAARALAGWREALGPAVDAVLHAWPDARTGFVRRDLDAYDATLDLYLGEAGEALRRWSGPADAWFLDGFAPSRNPDMWRPEVLAAVGRLSAPGARAASFTVAGSVRRGLAEAGFTVVKRPGFAAKRERLEAHLPGRLVSPTAPRRVAVIGAGIAGASLARAYARRGLACTVLDTAGPGAGASGNPAALVTPRLDAGFGPAAELHAIAFSRAVELYRRETPAAIIAEGALQLGRTGRDTERFRRLAGWGGFAESSLELRGAADAAEALDEPVEPATAVLRIGDALVVEPAAVLAAWLQNPTLLTGSVARLAFEDGVWACYGPQDTRLAEAEVLAVCAGAGTEALLPGSGLQPVRGQVEFTREQVFAGPAAAWGGYAVPLREGGALFGASHVRGDSARDLRAAETAANLAVLAERRPQLAARVRAQPGRLQARAAVRAATADHLPLAGWTAAGVQVLAGLGGRGFTLAPVLAEHLAALATGAPSPLPTDLAARLEPARSTQNHEPG